MTILDINNIVNLNNLIHSLDLNGTWYTEQTYISYIQSHKVYTFDKYGKVYSVLYIHGAFRLVDGYNGNTYDRYNIDNFKQLLLNVAYR